MLDISRNSISDDGIKSLAEHLDIKILCLNHNTFGIAGGRAIADNLKKRNVELKELDLSWSDISSDAAIAIAAGLEYCKSLKRLDLTSNKIGDSGVKEISKRLKFCEKLVNVSLQSNMISSDGAIVLVKGLKFSKNSLQSMDLSENQLGDDGAKALGECLGHCRKLQSINLTSEMLEQRVLVNA